jgi:hypothetical protein
MIVVIRVYFRMFILICRRRGDILTLGADNYYYLMLSPTGTITALTARRLGIGYR